MPDDLWISGSGVSAVATDELLAAAQQLGRIAGEASGTNSTLAGLSFPGGSAPAALAGAAIENAMIHIREGEARTRALEVSLGAAAEGYGFAERLGEQLATGIIGTLAGTLGFPGLLALAVPLVTAQLLQGRGAAGVSGVLGTTGAVSLLRATTTSLDDALLGSLGVPLPIARALGDEGLDVVGFGGAATATIAAGSAIGLFRETPVALVSTTAPRSVSAATGFAERMDRIPEGSLGQVTIEKFETPGQPDRFAVYIGGTASFDPVATDEPWDLTSNLVNAAGQGSGSYDAVVDAMRLAGVTSESEVQFTGYSQGAGTAAQLVASGDYVVSDLVTFGGPTGQVDLPPEVPTVIVEHSDDLVPALGGEQQNTHALIVERDVFGGVDMPSDEVVPAHRRENYLATAHLMDAAHSEQVTAAARHLDGFGAGSVVTSTTYRFERTSDGPSSAGEG